MKIVLLTLFVVLLSGAPLAQYYCGFSLNYCGQSTSDDTNANSSLIILAFANIAANGSVVMDTANYPCALVQKWQSQGKHVLLSIGGSNANWTPLMNNIPAGIASIQQILSQTTLDGVDLDIEQYTFSPSTVASFIQQLKVAIRGKYLTVAAQNVGIYQGQPVPNANSTSGTYWNYWVPIIQMADSSIDLYHVMAYDNWYDGLTEGSLNYYQDVYLNWINVQSPFCVGCYPIANFTGISPKKFVIGVMASNSAGSTAPTGPAIDQFQQWLSQNSYTLAGTFLWDSHWDALNNYLISNAITSLSTSTPLTPNPPAPSPLCNQTSSPAPRKKNFFK